ncbi:hypothetical protein Tco_1402572 [Tanacetum coccineum]
MFICSGNGLVSEYHMMGSLEINVEEEIEEMTNLNLKQASRSLEQGKSMIIAGLAETKKDHAIELFAKREVGMDELQKIVEDIEREAVAPKQKELLQYVGGLRNGSKRVVLNYANVDIHDPDVRDRLNIRGVEKYSLCFIEVFVHKDDAREKLLHKVIHSYARLVSEIEETARKMVFKSFGVEKYHDYKPSPFFILDEVDAARELKETDFFPTCIVLLHSLGSLGAIVSHEGWGASKMKLMHPS